MEDIEEKFDKLYYEDLGMCGCGHVEDLQQFLVDLMIIQNGYKAGDFSYDEKAKSVKLLIQDNHEYAFEFILHVLNNAEFLEHGTSVGGSWLTDKGKSFIKLYEQVQNL